MIKFFLHEMTRFLIFICSWGSQNNSNCSTWKGCSFAKIQHKIERPQRSRWRVGQMGFEIWKRLSIQRYVHIQLAFGCCLHYWTKFCLSGRTLPPEQLISGPKSKKTSYKEDNAEWNGMFRNPYQLYGPTTCTKWAVVYNQSKISWFTNIAWNFKIVYHLTS